MRFGLNGTMPLGVQWIAVSPGIRNCDVVVVSLPTAAVGDSGEVSGASIKLTLPP